MESTSGPLRTGQILIAALIFGMLSFAGVAAAMAGKISRPDPQLANMLFIVMGVLAVSELTAYHLLVRPIFIRQTRSQAQAIDPASRAAFIEPRYLNLTIIAGALAEGLGLLGAVTTLVTGRLEALAAPALAALALLIIIPTRDRLDRFVRAVTEEQPFSR